MKRWHTILLAFMALTLSMARAEVSLFVEERIAARHEGTWTKGEAAIVTSKESDSGLRLQAPAPAKDVAAALAVVMYRFSIPPTAKHLRLTVAYSTVSDKNASKEIAGSVWVSGETLPIKALPDKPMPMRGNMYVLSSAHTRAQFDFPAPSSVANGFVEIHAIASAGFAFDLAWLRLEAFDEGTRFVVGPPPPPPVAAPPAITYSVGQFSACDFYYGSWFNFWAPSCYTIIITNDPPAKNTPSSSETTRQQVDRPLLKKDGTQPVQIIPSAPIVFPLPKPTPPQLTAPVLIQPLFTSPQLVRPPEVAPPDIKPADVKPPSVRGFNSTQ